MSAEPLSRIERIAVDDTGATGKVQVFKLAYSDDGVSTFVPADVNGLLVQGALTISGGTVDTELPVPITVSDNMPSPTAPQVIAHLAVYDAAGTNWDRVRGDSTDGVLVNLGTNNDVIITAYDYNEDSGGSPFYTADTGSFTGEMGVQVLAIRNDGGATVLTAADLRHSPIAVDSAGRVGITALGGTIPVSGALTVSIAAGALTIAKAEDSTHQTGDVGVPAWAVRNDAAAVTFTNADGEYSPVAVDSAGRVGITTLGGTFTVDTELPAALALADDAVVPTAPKIGAVMMTYDQVATNLNFAREAAAGLNSTGTGMLQMALHGQLDDTGTTGVSEDFFGPLRMSSRRALLIEGVTSGTPVNGNARAYDGVTAGGQTVLYAETAQSSGGEVDVDITVTGYATIVVRISGGSTAVTSTAYTFHGRMAGSGGNSHTMQGRDIRTGEVVTRYNAQKSVDREYAFNVAGITTFRIQAGVLSAGTIEIEITGSVLLNPAVVSALVGPQAPRTSRFTHTAISCAASGENTLLAGTAGQTIRVMRMVLVPDADVVATIKNAAGGTALTGAMTLAAKVPFSVPNVGDPEFITADGGALILNLGSAIQVSGWMKTTEGV